MFGKVCKGAFNSATFKMELFATIRMLECCKGLPSSDGLTTNVFWNLQNIYLDKHHLHSTKKMLDYTVVKDCIWLSAHINNFPGDIYKLKVNITNSRTRSKIWPKKETRAASTNCIFMLIDVILVSFFVNFGHISCRFLVFLF